MVHLIPFRCEKKYPFPTPTQQATSKEEGTTKCGKWGCKYPTSSHAFVLTAPTNSFILVSDLPLRPSTAAQQYVKLSLKKNHYLAKHSQCWFLHEGPVTCSLSCNTTLLLQSLPHRCNFNALRTKSLHPEHMHILNCPSK